MTPISTIRTDYPEVEAPICNPEPPKKVEVVAQEASNPESPKKVKVVAQEALSSAPPVVVHVAPKKEAVAAPKTVEVYTEGIKKVLVKTIVQTDGGECYASINLRDRDIFDEAVCLLKALQKEDFKLQKENPADARHNRYKNQLEVLVNDYLTATFKGPADKNLVKLATTYLSFSRGQNSLELMPFEEILATFINTYANGEFMRFDNNQELSDVPVGIKNTDKASCFACAWMQLVANNRLLSAAYSAVRSEKFGCVQQVLKTYREVQESYQSNQKLLEEIDPAQREEVEKLLTLQPENIGSMREIIGAPGQQDASELISRLNGEIVIDANGKVGDIKLGAKIVKKVKHLQKKTEEVTQLDPQHPYTFPAQQFTLEIKDRFPSLSKLESTPDIAEDDGVRVAETRHYFAEAPNIVVYQLGRLVVEVDPKTHAVARRYVNRTEVDMPLYHTLGDPSPDAILKLQGFIRHRGGPNGGHYLSYMTQDNKYWLADDARVSEISAAEYLIAARSATTAVYSTVRKSTAEGKE